MGAVPEHRTFLAYMSARDFSPPPPLRLDLNGHYEKKFL